MIGVRENFPTHQRLCEQCYSTRQRGPFVSHHHTGRDGTHLAVPLELVVVYRISSYTLALTEEGETERRGSYRAWRIIPPTTWRRGDAGGRAYRDGTDNALSNSLRITLLSALRWSLPAPTALIGRHASSFIKM
eukprot:superscaffoldBa00002139_g13325